MTKLSDGILGKIKGEHICPRPRWCFLLKSCAFWSMLFVSVFLGSISFSVIVHLLTFGDFGMLGHLHGNLVTSAVMLVPYFWIFSLALFAAVAYFNWKHTKLGYRFRRRWIFVSSIVLSGFFGSVLYGLGMGKEIDFMMAKSMPFYDSSKHTGRSEIWLHPENGLLVGRIVEIDEPQNIMFIEDSRGMNWSVVKYERKIQPEIIVKRGKIVKIIGEMESENVFRANEIRSCGDCQDDEE